MEKKVGDKIKFNSRCGKVVTGKITKINIKTINVIEDVNLHKWKVSPSLVERVY